VLRRLNAGDYAGAQAAFGARPEAALFAGKTPSAQTGEADGVDAMELHHVPQRDLSLRRTYYMPAWYWNDGYHWYGCTCATCASASVSHAAGGPAGGGAGEAVAQGSGGGGGGGVASG